MDFAWLLFKGAAESRNHMKIYWYNVDTTVYTTDSLCSRTTTASAIEEALSIRQLLLEVQRH